MINIETFRSIISLLNSSNVHYSVFGGFAFDGIRGQITRDHKDIDIYLESSDLELLKRIFSREKCIIYKKDRMYYVESKNFRLGVVLMANEGESVIMYGNRTVVRSPSEIWGSKNIRRIDDVVFNGAPNEILVFDSQFSKYNEDKQLGSQLACDKDLYSNISIL